MTDPTIPDFSSERKFYPNFFKLYSLSVLLLGAAFLFAWNAVERASAETPPDGPGTGALTVLTLFLVGLAWAIWREASDRRRRSKSPRRG